MKNIFQLQETQAVHTSEKENGEPDPTYKKDSVSQLIEEIKYVVTLLWFHTQSCPIAHVSFSVKITQAKDISVMKSLFRYCFNYLL